MPTTDGSERGLFWQEARKLADRNPKWVALWLAGYIEDELSTAEAVGLLDSIEEGLDLLERERGPLRELPYPAPDPGPDTACRGL